MSDKIKKIEISRPWGAHMSVSGGVSKAIDRADSVGAVSIQIFTKNNNRWVGKPLSDEERTAFYEKSERLNVKVVASHDCYLINLASPDPVLHKKSCDAFLDEIDRADALDIPFLVFHPGAHKGEGEGKGVEKVTETLDMLMEQRPESKTLLTIENTAGQGTSLGYRFEHIGDIIHGSRYPERLAVCLDTCHVFAAGNEIHTAEGYEQTFDSFEKIIGLDKLAMFHVNDSKKGCGSRVDRHEHIGKGAIGLSAFERLVNDKRFIDTPMVLETPKGDDMAEDVMNLSVLKGLISR